jgi:hypothetical protein
LDRGCRAHSLLSAAIFLVSTFIGTPAAIFLVSTFIGTPAAIFLVVATWEFGAVGVAVYFAVTLILFGLLVLVSRREATMRGPWISLSAVIVASALVAWYWQNAWSYGMEYQGDWTVVTALWLNGMTLGVLVALLTLGTRLQSFRRQTLTHWVLSLWLASWAFPYFGEMP